MVLLGMISTVVRLIDISYLRSCTHLYSQQRGRKEERWKRERKLEKRKGESEKKGEREAHIHVPVHAHPCSHPPQFIPYLIFFFSSGSSVVCRDSFSPPPSSNVMRCLSCSWWDEKVWCFWSHIHFIKSCPFHFLAVRLWAYDLAFLCPSFLTGIM